MLDMMGIPIYGHILLLFSYLLYFPTLYIPFALVAHGLTMLRLFLPVMGYRIDLVPCRKFFFIS
jgi:hypothetical protein